MGKEHKKKVANIMSMGFSKTQAENALAISNENEIKAVDYLLS
jgi:hypothetical protein